MNVKNVKLSDAMKQLLAQVGDEKHHPQSAADGDVLIISTSEGLEAHAAAAKALAGSKPGPALQAQLARRLPEVKFDGVGLEDTLDFIKDVTHVAIVVDWKGLEDAGVSRNAPVTARFFDLPVGQVIRLLLDSVDSTKPVGLTVEGDKLLVEPVRAPGK